MDETLAVVDEFLETWDRFAQGDHELVPRINELMPAFSLGLAEMLRAGDKRAPSRMVFYAVVQVGGYIPVSSGLGQAALLVLGEDFPVQTDKDGAEVLFAGDLYWWWVDHRDAYEAYPLFDEWLTREFAQSTVIPLYENVRDAD